MASCANLFTKINAARTSPASFCPLLTLAPLNSPPQALNTVPSAPPPAPSSGKYQTAIRGKDKPVTKCDLFSTRKDSAVIHLIRSRTRLGREARERRRADGGRGREISRGFLCVSRKNTLSLQFENGAGRRAAPSHHVFLLVFYFFTVS